MNIVSLPRKFMHNFGNSLRFRLVASVMALALVPMLIGGILFYNYLFDALKDSNDKYLNSTLKSQANALDSKLRMVESASMLIISDPEIRKVLLFMENNPSETGTGSVVINERLKSLMLFNYTWDSRLIKSIYLITPDSRYYFITRSTFYTPTAQYLLESLKRKGSGEQYLILPSMENRGIFLARNINDLHFLKNYATLFIEIDQESLMQIQSDDSNSYPSTMLISKDNIIVSRTDPTVTGARTPEALRTLARGAVTEITLNKGKYLAVSEKSSVYDLSYVVFIPLNEAYAKMAAAKRTFSIIFMVILTLSLGIGILSAFVLTSPIKKMVKTLSESRSSNFKVKMPRFTTLELNELSSTYNKMTDEIDYLINQVYEKQYLLTEAKLQSLNSQVNPHFLFNILENINWEARIAKNEKIYQMTLALASLLRSTINFGNNEKIILSDELQIVSQYIKLQQMRFGDRISYCVAVNDALLDCYIPRFCIQTIVENSVIHGLEKKRSSGTISVIASLENASVTIIVKDDGTGFDVSKVNLDITRKATEGKHPHVGLYNAHKRIRLLYGDNYGLSISSTIGEGTIVQIRIPIDRKG